MIVYVETNFVLEIAYSQEQHAACEALLTLAKSGKMSLVVPAFALAEARLAWDRQASERSRFQQDLQNQIRQLSRSEKFKNLRAESAQLTAALVAGVEEVRGRLEATIADLSKAAEVPQLGTTTLENALQHEAAHGLRPPDALVLASVLEHAKSVDGSKVFITRDTKDFGTDPTIEDELKAVGVNLITHFSGGLSRLLKALDDAHGGAS